MGVTSSWILVVEDDRRLAATLERVLEAEGHQVDLAGDGMEALRRAHDRPPDLAILDVMLPGLDGIGVCKRLRATAQFPILMLTALGGTAERVRGLDSGADDYLVKPFALSELVARSRALVRRNQARGGSVLSLGNLRMDLEARRAYIGETELALAGREWSILQFMLSRTGKIVAKEQIIAAISNWDGTTSDNAIEVHVSRLRSKLEPAGLKIRTIRGFGYLLEEA